MSRTDILTEFGQRLEQINTTQRRLALPAVDAPHGLKRSQRIEHMRALLSALEAVPIVDERHIVDLGAHALAWVDALRAGQLLTAGEIPPEGAA